MGNYETQSKVESRQDAIIGPCLKIFKGSLPKHLQYWSMSHLFEGRDSELNQLVRSGLITEDQFHGADIDPQIIEANIALIREGKTSAHFHAGDIYQQMVVAKHHGNFNPGIINLDTEFMGPNAARLTAKITRLVSLDEDKKDSIPVIIINVVTKQRAMKKDPQKFYNTLFEEPDWQEANDNYDWQLMQTIPYKNGKSQMQQFCLYV